MKSRKRLAFGFTVVAAMLALASVAYACTTFKGKLQVTTGSTSSSAIGNGTGMGYCSGSPTGGATVARGANRSITVAVSPQACGSTTYQLSDRSGTGAYYVNFINWGKCGILLTTDCTGFKIDNTGKYTWWYDCMGTASTGYAKNLGRMDVSSGSGSRTYTIASTMMTRANGPSDASGICVSDSGENEGNQAPIAIT